MRFSVLKPTYSYIDNNTDANRTKTLIQTLILNERFLKYVKF